MIVFVTGPRGAGKTTFCESLFRYLTVDGSIAFLSRRQPDDKGYDLEILQSPPPENPSAEGPLRSPGGKLVSRFRIPLARRVDAAPDWTGDTLGPWVFSGDAFALAEKRFEEALDGLGKGGVLLLDEVGPLELTLGSGYSKILPRVVELPRVVMVIRPGLVGTLAARLDSHAKNSERTSPTPDPAFPDPVVIEILPGLLGDPRELERLLRRAGEALS
jgi:hypothetical protein